MTTTYKILVASDINRDGVGIELVDGKGHVVAEIFRSDDAKTVIASTFNHEVPLAMLERLILTAKQRLGPFEDLTVPH